MDNFNYLGVVFNNTGTFLLNQQHLLEKALKQCIHYYVTCEILILPPKTLCQLFDSFVGSILCYSCEVWGFSKSEEIERIHLKYCKQILGVKKMSTRRSWLYFILKHLYLILTSPLFQNRLLTQIRTESNERVNY